jgi:2-keto-4-pentenoate hydratase/2-oxohepta-3-ene-1,7-dioic acid hydratase in catechol pathway
MTLYDMLFRLHLSKKRELLLVILLIKGDKDKRGHLQADGSGVHPGTVAFNDARLFQTTDSPETRRFRQAKPWTSFTPVLVTPDELGSAWNGAKLSLPLRATLNDTLIGKPNAGVDMTFDFPTLISHCAKSRSLMTGTVIGSGTVSNVGSEEGSCCLAEVRCLEIIANGAPSTPFMSFGDRIKIEMIDDNGLSIFGNIDQIVKQYQPPT